MQATMPEMAQPSSAQATNAQAAPAMDEAQVREYFKQAVRDLIREEPELLRDVVEDIVGRMAMEDHALGLAMQQAESAPDAGETVSHEEIQRILRGEHLDEPIENEHYSQAKAA